MNWASKVTRYELDLVLLATKNKRSAKLNEYLCLWLVAAGSVAQTLPLTITSTFPVSLSLL